MLFSLILSNIMDVIFGGGAVRSVGSCIVLLYTPCVNRVSFGDCIRIVIVRMLVSERSKIKKNINPSLKIK